MNLIARFPPKSKENVHGFDSVKVTSLVEKRILTMDGKSKCNEAPVESKEDESSLRNSVGIDFISANDPIAISHPLSL